MQRILPFEHLGPGFITNQVVIVTCSSLHSLQESAVDFQEIEEALVLIKVSCPSFKKPTKLLDLHVISLKPQLPECPKRTLVR